MPSKTILQVELVDSSAAIFSADKVTFTTAGASTTKKSGPYLFDLTAAGEATVQIEKKGHHTYRFTLRVSKTGGDFTVSVDKQQMLDLPKMLTLLKLGAVGKASGVVRNQLTITIGRPREVLLVTGYDYPSDHGLGGMQFHKLGTRRMHALRKEGAIDDSTVVTWFDCRSGLRSRWVMGRGTEKVGDPPQMWSAGWSRLSTDGTPPSTLKPGEPDYPGAGVTGMAEIHQYIARIGAERPSTLQEFSIMSHSWFGGPILFNTSELDEFRMGGAKESERDPQDKDARFWKDFNTKNMPLKAKFVAAFSHAPFIRVWGCLATTSSLEVIKRAARAKNETEKLRIPVENRTLWFDGTTVFDDNLPGIIEYIRQSLLRANYMATLATVTGHTVEGGAPGMGALFTPLDKMGFQMFVARENVKSKDRKGDPVTIIGFKREMKFLENRMGVTITGDGYVQYSP